MSSTGRTNSAPPFLTSSPGMPQTTAVSRLGNGSPALLMQSRHRIGAVASHSGHQDLINRVALKCSSALVTIRSTLGCQG